MNSKQNSPKLFHLLHWENDQGMGFNQIDSQSLKFHTWNQMGLLGLQPN